MGSLGALSALLPTALSWLIFWPTWQRLLEKWLLFEQTLAHGLPTFGLYLFLLLKRPPWPDEPVRSAPGWPLAAIMAAMLASFGWAIMEAANIDALAFALLPVSIAALTWLLFGLATLRAKLPHLIVLGLALPFWGDLVQPLIQLASAVVGALIGLFGVTALIEGSSITLPYGRILIADGCSGIRYLAIALLLASLIATLNQARWQGWLLALAIGATLGVVVNWVRITALILIGYVSEMSSSLMTDHEAFGWLVFLVFAVPALFLAPVRRPDGDSRGPSRPHRRALLALLPVVLVGPVLLLSLNSAPGPQAPWALTGPDASRADRALPLPLELPGALAHQRYRLPHTWLQLSQFQRASTDEKMVPYIGTMVDASRWQRDETPEQSAGPGRPGQLTVYRDLQTGRNIAQLQWYRVAGFETGSYRLAKLLQIPSLFTGDDRFAVITLQRPCDGNRCAEDVRLLLEDAASIQLVNNRLSAPGVNA